MYIYVICPFCHGRHRHGYDPLDVIQWRESACGTYLLVPLPKDEYNKRRDETPYPRPRY